MTVSYAPASIDGYEFGLDADLDAKSLWILKCDQSVNVIVSDDALVSSAIASTGECVIQVNTFAPSKVVSSNPNMPCTLSPTPSRLRWE